jgi:KDO2-lipid IV(A) lauroyltransferase
MSDAARKTLAQRWLLAIMRLLGRVPLPLLYFIADALFFTLFRVFGFQRALARDNIARAFPQLPSAQVARLAAQSARNAAHVVFETIASSAFTDAELARRVVIDNPQLIERLVQEHRTVVTVAAHHANWEWLQLACAARLGAPLAALYKPLGRAGLDAFVQQLRGRFGSRLIVARTALPQLLQFARKPGVIALVADQVPRPDDDQYWSMLLGRDTAFFAGPEKLARLLKAPLVFAHMQRVRRGYYRVRFEVLAIPPYPQPDGELMERYIRALETQIRAAPQDWVWVYKRWKYRKSVYAG